MDREPDHCLGINNSLSHIHTKKSLGATVHFSEGGQNANYICTGFIWGLISGTWVNGKKWVCPSPSLSVWLVINSTATTHPLITEKALRIKPVVGIWLNLSPGPIFSLVEILVQRELGYI